MKDRIAHIMRAQNLKASDFAELLGIQPSGISHILSGRNQPSLDFVKKIKETFPEYNLDWIIFGKGPMTTSEPFSFTTPPAPAPLVEDTPPSSLFSTTSELPPSNNTPVAPETFAVKSGVKSLIVLYDDGTFENYSPK